MIQSDLYGNIQFNINVAFIAHNKTIYLAATPAIRTVADIAEAHGRPHSKILSTTPSNVDSVEGAFCKKLIDEAATFIEEMYDWTRQKVLDFIQTNSSNDFLYIKYTWKQLGKTQAWYDKMCKELTYEWRTIRREVDLHWTKSSDNSVFKEDELDELSNGLRPVLKHETIEISKKSTTVGEIRKLPYVVKILAIPDPNKVYFIGSDVGGGTGRDSTTLVVCDPEDGNREVAIFKNNTINTNNFTKLVIEVMRYFLPKSILFMENNSYGKAVLDTLIDEPDLLKRIYYEYSVSDKDKAKAGNNPSKVSNTITYGINTNVASRQLMIDILRELVTETPELIVSEDVYEDIKGLEYSKNGKVEHSNTSHDDSMFGRLMVEYAIRHGNNIARFLRAADSVAKTIRRAKALSSNNNPLGTTVDDPATNMGIDINFQDLVRRVQAGDSVEDVTRDMVGANTKRKLNNAALLQMQNKFRR